MTPSDQDDRDLEGLARSIDSLFSDEGAGADAAGDRDDSKEDDVEAGNDDAPASPAAPETVRSADPIMDVEMVPADDEKGDAGAGDRDEPPETIDLGSGVGGADDLDSVVAEASAPLDPEEPPGPSLPERSADESDPGAALRRAVEEYFAAGGPRRDELARRIRELAGRLKDRGDHGTLADAVERLAAPEVRGDDPAPAALARLLLTSEVAATLTRRLGQTRDEEKRRRMASLAASLGPSMAEAVGDALSETDDRAARRAYMDALVAMGTEGMDVVGDMVEDDRWFVVRNAVLILGEVGGERSVQHLTGTLAHDNPRVRRETLLSLAKIGGENAAMLVYGKLDDPDPTVREAAAMAAGELRIGKAVRPLTARLDGENDEDVVIAVIRALGALGDPGAVQALEKKAVGSFLSRPPTSVRVAAYRALAAIGTPHATKLLDKAADDKDAEVREAVRSILARAE